MTKAELISALDEDRLFENLDEDGEPDGVINAYDPANDEFCIAAGPANDPEVWELPFEELRIGAEVTPDPAEVEAALKAWEEAGCPEP